MSAALTPAPAPRTYEAICADMAANDRELHQLPSRSFPSSPAFEANCERRHELTTELLAVLAGAKTASLPDVVVDWLEARAAEDRARAHHAETRRRMLRALGGT